MFYFLFTSGLNNSPSAIRAAHRRRGPAPPPPFFLSIVSYNPAVSGRPALNYSSRHIQTYKQVLPHLPPTSCLLCMLSPSNTWLRRMGGKKKIHLILAAVCVINIRGEEEVSVETGWKQQRGETLTQSQDLKNLTSNTSHLDSVLTL